MRSPDHLRDLAPKPPREKRTFKPSTKLFLVGAALVAVGGTLWVQGFWDFCAFDAALRGHRMKGNFVYLSQCPDINQYGHFHTCGGVIALLGVVLIGAGIYRRLTSE